MFGMLDYRAHKLLWLLWLPFLAASWLLYFISIGVGIALAASTDYSIWIKLAIAYVVFEPSLIVCTLIIGCLRWMVKTAFFWTIDVVPMRGSDLDNHAQW